MLQALAAQAGQPIPLETYAVATPTDDGLHLYFRQPEGAAALRNSQGRLGVASIPEARAAMWSAPVPAGMTDGGIGSCAPRRSRRFPPGSPHGSPHHHHHHHRHPLRSSCPAPTPSHGTFRPPSAPPAPQRLAQPGRRHTVRLRAARICGQYIGGRGSVRAGRPPRPAGHDRAPHRRAEMHPPRDRPHYPRRRRLRPSGTADHPYPGIRRDGRPWPGGGAAPGKHIPRRPDLRGFAASPPTPDRPARKQEAGRARASGAHRPVWTGGLPVATGGSRRTSSAPMATPSHCTRA